MRFMICAAAAVLLSACAAPAPAPSRMTTAFVASEHEAYRQPGTNTVTGQGFLRQRGGGTVTCAGDRVLLMPATAYFRETVAILRAGGTPDVRDSLPLEYKTVAKVAQCDADGNFSIPNVPPGNYILMTQVRWTVNSSRQGGMLEKEISVPDNSSSGRILLSDNDILRRR